MAEFIAYRILNGLTTLRKVPQSLVAEVQAILTQQGFAWEDGA